MKIDRYQGFIFEGEGYVTDHLECKKVITFNLGIYDDKREKELLKLCLDFLNEDKK